MTRAIDERVRWCAAFAALLIDETRTSAADALFLAEQARVRFPGLPPSYAVRMALTGSHLPAPRVVAGRRWGGRAEPVRLSNDEGAVGW